MPFADGLMGTSEIRRGCERGDAWEVMRKLNRMIMTLWVTYIIYFIAVPEVWRGELWRLIRRFQRSPYTISKRKTSGGIFLASNSEIKSCKLQVTYIIYFDGRKFVSRELSNFCSGNALNDGNFNDSHVSFQNLKCFYWLRNCKFVGKSWIDAVETIFPIRQNSNESHDRTSNHRKLCFKSSLNQSTLQLPTILQPNL